MQLRNTFALQLIDICLLLTDYEQLTDTLAQRPLKGSLLSIQKVKIPNAVQVNNVQQISKDMLTLFFENPGRSGGGAVKNLMKDETDSCAVVEFEDQKGNDCHLFSPNRSYN